MKDFNYLRINKSKMLLYELKIYLQNLLCVECTKMTQITEMENMCILAEHFDFK